MRIMFARSLLLFGITSTLFMGCSTISDFKRDNVPIIKQCVQNFEVAIGSQWIARATIPPDCLEQTLHINELLQKKQGRAKDTDFQKVDISNLVGSFINGGYKVNGNWKLQIREVILINRDNNKVHYTPWTEDTGSFSQEIAIKIENGIIVVQPSNYSLSREPQGLFRDLLGDFIVYSEGKFRDKLVAEIRNGLNTINGKAIADMLIDSGAAKQLATKALIDEQQAITLINAAAQRMDARISPKGLDISLILKL